MLFKFPETETDVVLYEDPNKNVWCHAGAVCSIFGFTNATVATEAHCPGETQLIQYQEGKGRPALFVSESGLYLLIMGSKNPLAVKFKRWLAYEVLPSIRKTGEYKATAADQQHFAPFGLTVQIATVEEAQGKNQLALQNAEPGTGQVLTLVKESAALRQEKIALDRLLKATPTKEAVDRDQAIENHILERLGRFPKGVTIQHLIVSRFLEKHQARRIKVILPVLQKLRSQGRCEEISPNTWKLTGDPS